MDRLTSLKVFGQVVECGGFSAAGRKLNMSVAAVSNHVQSLEERLGVRLLNRTTRKVSLTEIGKAYYERSQQILRDLEEADRITESLNTAPRGRLSLYANAHLMGFLSPIIAEYLRQYPEVSIQLTSGQQMVDLVEMGLDLVIAATPPPDSTLVVRRLSPWRPILCCSPAYQKKISTLKEPSDLARYNCIQYAHYPYGSEWRFEGANGRVAKVRVHGNAVSDNGELLRTLALEGQGVIMGPSFLIGDDVKAKRLVRLLPSYRPVEFSINTIFPHRHHLSSKVRVFIDLLAERFAAHLSAIS